MISKQKSKQQAGWQARQKQSLINPPKNNYLQFNVFFSCLSVFICGHLFAGCMYFNLFGLLLLLLLIEKCQKCHWKIVTMLTFPLSSLMGAKIFCAATALICLSLVVGRVVNSAIFSLCVNSFSRKTQRNFNDKLWPDGTKC